MEKGKDNHHPHEESAEIIIKRGFLFRFFFFIVFFQVDQMAGIQKRKKKNKNGRDGLVFLVVSPLVFLYIYIHRMI
jgi:hypothetical protein